MRDDSSEGRLDEDMLFVTIFLLIGKYLGELTLLITHETPRRTVSEHFDKLLLKHH